MPPLSKDIASREIGVKGRTTARSTNGKHNVFTARCWRRFYMSLVSSNSNEVSVSKSHS